MDLNTLKLRGIPRIVLYQTPSSILDLYIEDIIRGKCESNKNTVFEIKKSADAKEVRGFNTIQPFDSKRWLIKVNIDKFKPDKMFYKMVSESTTTVYLIKVSNYRDYKTIKEEFKGYQGVFDYYISYLKSRDFNYLFNEFVVETGKRDLITRDMEAYIKAGYSGDVDELMQLFAYVRDTIEKTPITKELIKEICGVGGNTLDTFMFNLLKEPPKATEKSLKIVLRKRTEAGRDLAESYGWSKFGAYLGTAVSNLISVKELIISNTIYDSVSKMPDEYDKSNLPHTEGLESRGIRVEGYDKKKLLRYSRYIWRINEIPMSRLIRLKVLLSENRWSSETEFFLFLYQYYILQVMNETLELKEVH